MDNSTFKILVVDDENDILEFIQYNLKKEGYDVYLAHNGQEAIDIGRKIESRLNTIGCDDACYGWY
jgi:two-component system alkaline phosphatase synthesis response regulator PhoP